MLVKELWELADKQVEVNRPEEETGHLCSERFSEICTWVLGQTGVELPHFDIYNSDGDSFQFIWYSMIKGLSWDVGIGDFFGDGDFKMRIYQYERDELDIPSWARKLRKCSTLSVGCDSEAV